MTAPKEQLLAEWEAIQKSAGWRMYEERVAKALGASVEGLKKSSDPTRLFHLQGEVAAYELVTRLPEALVKDLLKMDNRPERPIK
jgi:hypothetical protein